MVVNGLKIVLIVEYPGDQPPPEMYDHHERYGTAPGSYPGTGRNGDDSFSGKIYHGLITVSNRLRQSVNHLSSKLHSVAKPSIPG